MAWAVPRTWSAGELVTASIMNQHVRDNFNAFSTQLWIWTGDQTWNDNVKVTFGTGGDADVYYDAANLVINPAVVGSGGVDFTGCDIGVDAAKKIHVSGLAGDTFWWEPTANVQAWETGGVETVRYTSAGVIFNEPGANNDFRVEGDTLAYMLFLDGTATTQNIAIFAGSAPDWETLDRGLFFGNMNSAPTGTPVGGGFLYVDAGALKWIGTSGTTTTLGVA